MNPSDPAQIAIISDAIERAREITRAIAQHQALINELAQMRRQAITEAQQSGMTQAQIAKALGVTQGRVSQMGAVPGVLTGWLVPAAQGPEPRITISGSRAEGTDSRLIDDVVRSLAGLLVRRRCRVIHGPVGVGIEVITHIADHYRPPGLGAATGVFGRPNVVRDADFVLIIGGGEGTQAEFDLATSIGKKTIPWPASGGTATRAYSTMQRQPELRGWLPEEDFAALSRITTADEYVGFIERLLDKADIST